MKSHPLYSILKEVNKYSCPKLCNFHCHTTCSDGSLTPTELIKQAIQLNLKNIAITDHHCIKAYIEANKWLVNNNHKINIWSGIEISCLLDSSLVHIIGLGFDLYNEPLMAYTNGESVKGTKLEAKNVINAIKEANGISVLAHPARYKQSFTELIYKAHRLNIDAIEVWYNYERDYNWEPSPYICDQMEKIVNNLGLLSSCGTDTHGYSLLRR